MNFEIILAGIAAIVIAALCIEVKFDKNRIAEFKSQIEILKQDSARAQQQTIIKHNIAINNLKIKQKSVEALMHENVANDCQASITWAISQAENFG
jgi:hypothetical protein